MRFVSYIKPPRSSLKLLRAKMATLSDIVGDISQIARDPTASPQLVRILKYGDPTKEELRSLVEKVTGPILEIAVNFNGSRVLGNLAWRLSIMELSEEIELLFTAITHDAQRLKNSSMLLKENGIRTLFAILDFIPHKKPAFVHTLGLIIVDMLFLLAPLTPFFRALFAYYAPIELRPLAIRIAQEFVSLSKHTLGSTNLDSSIQVCGLGFKTLLVSSLEESAWKACLEKDSNLWLRNLISPDFTLKLWGKFFSLSTHRYGNYLLRDCFDLGDDMSCFFIATELDPHMRVLTKHRFGNNVVRHLISRFKRMNAPLPPLLGHIMSECSRDLISNEWGILVLRCFFNA